MGEWLAWKELTISLESEHWVSPVRYMPPVKALNSKYTSMLTTANYLYLTTVIFLYALSHGECIVHRGKNYCCTYDKYFP